MRVDRSFAFIDLCGFTEFADRHGDERVVLVLAQMRTLMRESCARRGVRIVKWMGDGAMLSSTMNDALVGLVVELDQRMADFIPALPIRAGLASGPVIMFEGDDYIGSPVNIAARLCAIAAPHELLATVEVAEARPGWVLAGAKRLVSVRGVRREVEAQNLTLLTPDDPVVDPVCGLTIDREDSVGLEERPRFCSEACLGSWLDRLKGSRVG
ncbi:MAG TPA: adenylate/guanylate cyclase domain-containing protein [Acidimicrobiales bacterium]|nr:adenylate/guanylate cyclase domain-containing protein [Acidimicrobiales bacterium]